MQKELSPIIFFLLCYMNRYSLGIICSSDPIRTHSTSYSYSTLHCGYCADPFRCGILFYRCLRNETSHEKLMLISKWWFFINHFHFGSGSPILENQPLQLFLYCIRLYLQFKCEAYSSHLQNVIAIFRVFYQYFYINLSLSFV